MNYQSIERSDTIMQKLGHLKNAIHQPENQNLNDYLPHEKINTNQCHNHHSYRKSLQKKLQRLFKEEKQMFSEGASRNYQESDISQLGIKNGEGFTVDKMEQKIRQLERKYLNFEKVDSEKQKKISKEASKIVKSKNLSYSEKVTSDEKPSKSSPNRKKYNQTYDDKKLKLQLSSIKKEVANLNRMNAILIGKLENKDQVKKQRKSNSKEILRQILGRLDEIRHNLQGKRQRSKGKEENENTNELMGQLEEVTRLLKKETIEKQLLEEKNAWIENQLKFLNAQ